jgi:hypothetical protein
MTTKSMEARFEASVDVRDLTAARRDRVRFLHVPERRFLAVDGTEVPGGEAFQGAIATLYPVAYALHFGLKRRSVAAPVGMLESLFWLTPAELLDGVPTDGSRVPERGWRWRVILPVPGEATEVDVEDAIASAVRRTPLPALELLHVITWEEGDCAQILHVGPYDAEAPTIRRLHDAIAAAGLRPGEPHHEIYLNDPFRVGPEKTKTVIRHPVS